uniref:Uncharacterized protein n=1 Tax=Pyxicephalus adspersus TaxID=30357 RepID=A0AAV2ZLX6_PYXAD|nr:TPA: hypothetical protein GDO54_002750 [Pyxicephalus adspersus]
MPTLSKQHYIQQGNSMKYLPFYLNVAFVVHCSLTDPLLCNSNSSQCILKNIRKRKPEIQATHQDGRTRHCLTCLVEILCY